MKWKTLPGRESKTRHPRIYYVPGTCIKPSMNTRGDAPFIKGEEMIVAAALVAAISKIGIALLTLGTNDIIAFYQFGKALETHGLTWTYEHSALFNHPPLVGYFLQGLAWVDHQPFFRENGLTFPFLLRFPGIVADFVVVLLVLFVVREHPHLRPPRWALILFAASPVSIMIAGFHGNTDPILVLFLLLAAILAGRSQPVWCGLVLAISCQVKIIPLLLLPVFFVVCGIFLLAWRRRKLANPALFATLGYAWMIFFVLSPGVAAQYLIWLGPFILLLSPNFYGFVVAGSSIFLFALYTITSGGFPWYFAHASNKLNVICAHWALVPWLVLAGGLFAVAWKVRRENPDFRFVSLKSIEPVKNSE